MAVAKASVEMDDNIKDPPNLKLQAHHGQATLAPVDAQGTIPPPPPPRAPQRRCRGTMVALASMDLQQEGGWSKVVLAKGKTPPRNMTEAKNLNDPNDDNSVFYEDDAVKVLFKNHRGKTTSDDGNDDETPFNVENCNNHLLCWMMMSTTMRKMRS
jgi:hypothetical protein